MLTRKLHIDQSVETVAILNDFLALVLFDDRHIAGELPRFDHPLMHSKHRADVGWIVRGRHNNFHMRPTPNHWPPQRPRRPRPGPDMMNLVLHYTKYDYKKNVDGKWVFCDETQSTSPACARTGSAAF